MLRRFESTNVTQRNLQRQIFDNAQNSANIVYQRRFYITFRDVARSILILRAQTLHGMYLISKLFSYREFAWYILNCLAFTYSVS